MEIALIPGLFVGIFALGAALILWFPYDRWCHALNVRVPISYDWTGRAVFGCCWNCGRRMR